MAFWEDFKWLFQPTKQRRANDEENEDDEKLNAIAKSMIDGLKWLDFENSSYLKHEETDSESRLKQHVNDVCEKASTEEQNTVSNFSKDKPGISTDKVSSTKQESSSQTTSLEDQCCILNKQTVKNSLSSEQIAQSTVLSQDPICNNDQIQVCEKASTEEQNTVSNFSKDKPGISTDEVSSTKQESSSQTTSLEDQCCILSKQAVKNSLSSEESGQSTVLSQDPNCNNDQILNKSDTNWVQTEPIHSETQNTCFGASKYVPIYSKPDALQSTTHDCIIGALKEYLQTRKDENGNQPPTARRFLIKKCAANKNGSDTSYMKCASLDSCAEINNLILVSIVTSNDDVGRIRNNSQTNSEEKFTSKSDCNGSKILIENDFPLSDDNQDGRYKCNIAEWISSKEAVLGSAEFNKEASESGKGARLSTRLCDINSTEGQKILSASVIRDSKGLPVLFRSSKGVTLCVFNDNNKADDTAANRILEGKHSSAFPPVFVEEHSPSTSLETPGDTSEALRKGEENDNKIDPEASKDLRINRQDSTVGDTLSKCEESKDKINLSKCDKSKDKMNLELSKDLRIDLQDSHAGNVSGIRADVCRAENVCVDKCASELPCSFSASKEISSNVRVIKFQNQPVQVFPKFFKITLFQVPGKAVSESDHPLCKVSNVTTLTNEEWAQLDNNALENEVSAQENKGNFITSNSNAVPDHDHNYFASLNEKSLSQEGPLMERIGKVIPELPFNCNSEQSINKNEAALSRTVREQDSSTSVSHNYSKENRNYVGTFISAKKIYQCRICDYHTNNEISFSKHQVKHRSDESFECEQCKKKFKCAGSLVNHLKHHASGKGENEFECSICGEMCTDEDNLIAHRKGHAKDRNFKCFVCSQTLSSWRAFLKHKKQPCKPKTKDAFNKHNHREERKKRKKKKKVAKKQTKDRTALKLTEKTEIPSSKENDCHHEKNKRKRHFSGDSELIIDIPGEVVRLEQGNKKPKTA